MSFGKVTLGLFRLFLLIGPFSRLEYFICKTLESVAVPGLVLFLGVEDVDVIQKAIKFTRPGPILLVASWSFHRINGMIYFTLLVMALG
jgi:hypothetical protein